MCVQDLEFKIKPTIKLRMVLAIFTDGARHILYNIPI